MMRVMVCETCLNNVAATVADWTSMAATTIAKPVPAHAGVASRRHRKAVARVRFMRALERLTGIGVNGDRNPVR